MQLRPTTYLDTNSLESCIRWTTFKLVSDGIIAFIELEFKMCCIIVQQAFSLNIQCITSVIIFSISTSYAWIMWASKQRAKISWMVDWWPLIDKKTVKKNKTDTDLESKPDFFKNSINYMNTDRFLKPHKTLQMKDMCFFNDLQRLYTCLLNWFIHISFQVDLAAKLLAISVNRTQWKQQQQQQRDDVLNNVTRNTLNIWMHCTFIS